MILKGGGMDHTTVNYGVIVFILCISIKVVKLSILNNSPVNIVPMHIKRSMRFKFYESETVLNHASSLSSVESRTLRSQSVSEVSITGVKVYHSI